MSAARSGREAEAVDLTSPAGREAETGGEETQPEDDADIYRQLGAERSAIMVDFARRIATAGTGRHSVKSARKAALAAAKNRAKAEVAARKARRKERKATRRDRARRFPSSRARPAR